MSLLDSLENEQLIVQAVEFGVDVVTVHFQEKREVTNTAVVSRTMEILMNDERREQRYLFLQELLRDLVDETYIDIRNPDSEL